MPKRLCPFDNDIVRQTKIHVSQKEIDNNSASIEKVYTKTIQMLFQGTKNYMTTKGTKVVDNSEMKTNLIFCAKCHSKQNLKKCTFCEKIFCGNCIFLCVACQEDFCQICSVAQFVDNNDCHICLNCC